MKYGSSTSLTIMSRVGKKPILIPEGVYAQIEGKRITIKGPKGEISREFRPEINLALEDKKIIVSPASEDQEVSALWGTTRAIINNLVKGVTEGFEKKLEINGLGFKANLSENILELSLGFSHPIKFTATDGIKFSVEKNIVTVSGIDLEKVSQTAAQIKRVRKPEPYKGTGIKYLGEQIRRKEGKKAAATTK